MIANDWHLTKLALNTGPDFTNLGIHAQFVQRKTLETINHTLDICAPKKARNEKNTDDVQKIRSMRDRTFKLKDRPNARSWSSKQMLIQL
jgi:hypothetical protein